MMPQLVILLAVGVEPVEPLSSPFKAPNTPLAAQVAHDFPELAEAQTDWERVRMLNSWAWANTDMASHRYRYGRGDDPLQLDQAPVVKGWFQQSAEEFYGHFVRRRGGVSFNSCAMGCAALMKHFGYKAWWTYSAMPGGSFVVVEISHQGHRVLAVVDPLFNDALEAMADPGVPLDHRDELAMLAAKRHRQLRWVGPDYSNMPRIPLCYVNAQRVGQDTPVEVCTREWAIAEGFWWHDKTKDGDLIFTSPRLRSEWRDKHLWQRVTGEPLAVKRYAEAGLPADAFYGHACVLEYTAACSGVDREMWELCRAAYVESPQK